MSARRGVVVVGSSNVDFIMQLPKLPTLGETVTNGQFQQTFGGKGANQAVAAARSGAPTTFITALGDDYYGDQMIENFNRDGINTSAIVRSANVASGSALVMFDQEGRNLLAVAPGANYTLLPAHIEANAQLIADADFVVMQMEIPTETTLRILAIARQSSTRVVFNYAPAHNFDVPISDAIHTLLVNEVEAQQLTDIEISHRATASQAARELLLRGPRNVILTLGKDGTFVTSRDDQKFHENYVPAYRVEAVDTTAAGDVFCGAFATALIEGHDLVSAARFANAASALSVTKQGAQPSVPWRHEIDAFFAANLPVANEAWT